MKKIRQMKSKKGFSLVELLIVIAIMAVLVGILAPQYIKYVERSRQATDLQVVGHIVTIVKNTTVDFAYADATPVGDVIVTWASSTDGSVTVTFGTPHIGGNATEFQKAMTEMIGTSVKPKSNAAKAGSIEITCSVDASGLAKVTTITPVSTDANFTKLLDGIID